MTPEPLYTVVTAYTLSQYRDYNHTVQRVVGRVWYRLVLIVAVYVVLGSLISYMFGSPVWVLLFLLLAVAVAYSQVRAMRRAEDAQYQREQLAGTVTLSFFDGWMEMSSEAGSAVNTYGTVQSVLERPGAFYVMFPNRTGAIVPKEDMPPGLEEFIRSRFEVRSVRPGRIRGRFFFLSRETPARALPRSRWT